jgi:C4-dicarboxylate-specific signal transduction histidine kinase
VDLSVKPEKLMVSADPVMMEQIMTNYLKNALISSDSAGQSVYVSKTADGKALASVSTADRISRQMLWSRYGPAFTRSIKPGPHL